MSNDNRIFITAEERKADLYVQHSNFVRDMMAVAAVCMFALALSVLIFVTMVAP